VEVELETVRQDMAGAAVAAVLVGETIFLSAAEVHTPLLLVVQEVKVIFKVQAKF
jgi:hypothetical protein